MTSAAMTHALILFSVRDEFRNCGIYQDDQERNPVHTGDVRYLDDRQGAVL